jgi:hypothetical protein
MARVALIALTIAAGADLALAVLLFTYPGLLFETALPGTPGADSANMKVAALLAFSVVAPIVGFALRSLRRPVGGILIGWLPPVAALFAAALPS